MMGKTAVIGGTGVYDPQLLDHIQEQTIATPYGEVSLLQGTYKGQEVLFLNRHGKGHSVPPHLINYRANIKALQLAGADKIITTAAVGSLNFDYKPGMLVLPDQFLDFTKCREHTFYTGGEAGVLHCDMTVPYCNNLRQVMEQTATAQKLDLVNGGVYVCTEGPRFETAAEIAMFKELGGDVIGMTSVPEVSLSRELGMCYANIAIVTNFAAGISPATLTHAEVLEVMGNSISYLRPLIMESVLRYAQLEPCTCGDILRQGEVKP
jgi:5'-methylthioadenosine phosphorylase